MDDVGGVEKRRRQICEDSAQELNSEELGRPLNQLVPMLLHLFSHPKDSFRVMALTCINSLIPMSPQALLLNMDAYLEVRIVRAYSKGGLAPDRAHAGQQGREDTCVHLKFFFFFFAISERTLLACLSCPPHPHSFRLYYYLFFSRMRQHVNTRFIHGRAFRSWRPTRVRLREKESARPWCCSSRCVCVCERGRDRKRESFSGTSCSCSKLEPIEGIFRDGKAERNISVSWRGCSGRQRLSVWLTEPTRNARAQADVEILLPRMQGICEFMLAAQQDPDPEVRGLVGGVYREALVVLLCVDAIVAHVLASHPVPHHSYHLEFHGVHEKRGCTTPWMLS